MEKQKWQGVWVVNREGGKAGREGGGGCGGGGLTAELQRNQIKTDNKWSAEEACGQPAEVREPLTTTITNSASAFLSAVFARFFVCIPGSHFFLTLFHQLRRSYDVSFPCSFYLHSLLLSALSGTFSPFLFSSQSVQWPDSVSSISVQSLFYSGLMWHFGNFNFSFC